MSQTNTNTGGGNTNHNQNAARGGRGQGGYGDRGRGGRTNYCRNSSIAKYSFEGEMKDCCLFKLTITECTHLATQYKKIINALLVLCADKGSQFFDDATCTNR